MHSNAIRPLVADLLATHGYSVHDDESLEGRSGAVYNIPLLAEGDDVLLLEFKDSSDPVEADDLDYLALMVEDAGADRAILIHQGTAPHHLPQLANVTLWGPDRLRTALGDHLIHQATGAPLAPLPRTPELARTAQPLTSAPEPVGLPPMEDLGFSDLLPSAFQDDEEEEAMIGLDFDSLESLATPVPPAAVTPAADFGPSAIKPRVPIHEARAMVSDRISRIEVETLMLRPIHLVDYECDLMVDGSLLQDTVNGRVQVSGDKQGIVAVDLESMDISTIGTIAWDGPIDEHPFRRDADRALSATKELVMETHTKMVDVQADDEASDFTMVERKKVAPNGDQIRLAHKAATYRPAWKFEGPNGHVIIDGLTGETLDESLRTRRGDTIILD